MKMLKVVAGVAFGVGLLTASGACGQQSNPWLRGVWALNVQKSDFGSDPKPKAGQVNWTEHGWVFAIITADGGLYADGALTDHCCSLIGVSDYSCTFEVVTPRHVRLTQQTKICRGSSHNHPVVPSRWRQEARVVALEEKP